MTPAAVLPRPRALVLVTSPRQREERLPAALEALGFDVLAAPSAESLVGRDRQRAATACAVFAVDGGGDSGIIADLQLLKVAAPRSRAIAVAVSSASAMANARALGMATLGADWNTAQLHALLERLGLNPDDRRDTGAPRPSAEPLKRIELVLDVMYSLRLMHDLDLESAWILMIVAEATLRPFSGPQDWNGPANDRAAPRGAISRRMVAEKTGISRETVRRRVRELLNNGYLVSLRHGMQLAERCFEDARMLAILGEIDRLATRYVERRT